MQDYQIKLWSPKFSGSEEAWAWVCKASNGDITEPHFSMSREQLQDANSRGFLNKNHVPFLLAQDQKGEIVTNFQCKACISQGIIPNTTHAPNVCEAVSIDKIFDYSDLKWQLAYKWHVVSTIYCELEALEKLILTTPDLQNAIAAVTQRFALHDNIEYQFQIIEDIERRLEKETP